LTQKISNGSLEIEGYPYDDLLAFGINNKKECMK